MRRWLLRHLWPLAAGTVAVAVLVLAIFVSLSAEAVTAHRFSAIRGDGVALRNFLQRMPKGGDLHVHLSGAVYAEDLIAWGAKNGLCLDRPAMRLVGPPCYRDSNIDPLVEVVGNRAAHDEMVNAFSMRNFLPSAAARSRHDQFFATFDRFSASASGSTPDMVVNQLRHYATESVQYVELMVSFLSGDDRRALAQGLSGKTDFPAMLETVRKNGLDRMIAAERNQVAQLVEAVDKLLGCGAARERPGCQVDYRFIVQVSRNNPPEEVFAQAAAAAALIRADPRVVGLNFVQPEDYLRARQDYSLQMRMVQFLASDVPVSLHAGELWLGLVPPSDLTFHIREAVTVAGARRIGHGVSLAFEGDMSGLLAEMRRRRVAVEINLTSNDVILGVRGEDHPLRTYLAAGVPVVLSTDDAGVSRIDLTNEYIRATREHGLDYYALKTVAHNALQYSFLDEAEKEKELKSLDRSFTAFEAGTAEEFSPLVRFRKFLCGCR